MARILYIDDDALMTQIMLDQLRAGNRHTVRYEKRADAAGEAIKSGGPFDLIILDFMMRKYDLDAKEGETQTGFILYRMIRESNATLPIIALTVISKDNAPRALGEDPNLYWMRKPVQVEDLLTQIDKELNK